MTLRLDYNFERLLREILSFYVDVTDIREICVYMPPLLEQLTSVRPHLIIANATIKPIYL
jgi:hypothetical protein